MAKTNAPETTAEEKELAHDDLAELRKKIIQINTNVADNMLQYGRSTATETDMQTAQTLVLTYVDLINNQK